MSVVYFKSEDDGDGSYDGQIGRAYLHLADGSTGDEDRDLGFITLATAKEIAGEHGAELDVDGPTPAEWDEVGVRPRTAQLFGSIAIVVGVAIVLVGVIGGVTPWLTIGASLLVIGWLVLRWWRNAQAWSRLEDESRQEEEPR